MIVPTKTLSGQTARNPARLEAFCNHNTPSSTGGAAKSVHAKVTGQSVEHKTGGPTLPQKQHPPPSNPPKKQASKHNAPQARNGADASNEHIAHPEHAQVTVINGNEHKQQTGAQSIPKK